MAKTDDDLTLVWVSLDIALARVRARCPGEALPSLMIKAGIEAESIRCRAWFYKGRITGDPNIDEPAFWQISPGVEPPIANWKQSYVRRRCGGFDGKGYTAHRVEVVLIDIDALITAWRLPEPIPAPELKTPEPVNQLPAAPISCPAPPESEPEAASSRKVSVAELEQCFRAIMDERPNDPPSESWMLKEVDARLGRHVTRQRIRDLWKTLAPEWKKPEGIQRRQIS